MSDLITMLLATRKGPSIRRDLPRAEYLSLLTTYTALTTYATVILQVPVLRAGETPGFIHIGDMVVLLAGLRLGAFEGALVGGVGCALADLLSPPFGYFAPLSLVAHAAEGAIAGLVRFPPLAATFMAESTMLALYFVGERLMFGGWKHAVSALPLNAVQALFGLVFALFIFWQLGRLFGNQPASSLAASPKNEIPDDREKLFATTSGVLGVIIALVVNQWQAPREMLNQYGALLTLPLYQIAGRTLIVHVTPIVLMVAATVFYLIAMVTLFLIQVRLALWLATLVPAKLRAIVEALAVPVFIFYIAGATLFFQAVRTNVLKGATPETNQCVEVHYQW